MIVAAKYVTRDNKVLLAKLCRNILSMKPKDSGRYGSLRVNGMIVSVFIEVLYPVKYAIFLAE